MNTTTHDPTPVRPHDLRRMYRETDPARQAADRALMNFPSTPFRGEPAPTHEAFRARLADLCLAQGEIIDQRFAVIGAQYPDYLPVVWGVGDTRDAALLDGVRNLVENLSEGDTRPELRIVAITEERYRAVTAGDVDATGLEVAS